MSYFLAKTDPETYSIDDFERDQRTVWDGVTNAQAVRVIRAMRPGDRVFVYHSGGVSSVVGIAQVKSQPRDDPRNPKSAVVDLEFLGRLETPLSLAEIKQSNRFDDWESSGDQSPRLHRRLETLLHRLDADPTGRFVHARSQWRCAHAAHPPQ